MTQPSSNPTVQGQCPACRGTSLFLGAGGHVTCARIDCPNPTAADDFLHSSAAPLVTGTLTHLAEATATLTARLDDHVRAVQAAANRRF
ncbi:DUF6085 family protein [Streptomyces omiyaensis]|uniref:DUF6085 family protein n=1 Tax=Streptomyces omiyaensis TaxID=68247 RepID=UPI0036FB74E1